MTRKANRLLHLCMVAVLLVCSTAWLLAEVPDSREEEQELLKRATALVHRYIVIDGHADTPSKMVRGYNIRVRNNENHVDLPRLLEAGVDGQFFVAFVFPNGSGGSEIQQTLEMFDAVKQVAAQDNRLVIARTAEDIVEAHRNGTVAGLLCIEGGHVMMDSLAVLRMYYELGARYMTLTWNNTNNWADGCSPDQSRYGNHGPHGGLTDFGREVIREMNRLGMIVDISHVHEDTFWDAMEVTSKPVIASHSCAWALNPHERNMKDDMLRAVAENGGVVGINFYAAFISKGYNEAVSAIREEYMEEAEKIESELAGDTEAIEAAQRRLRESYRDRVSRPPLSALIDQIEHVAEVAGHDHVGLGSDWDGISAATEDLDDVTDLPLIVMELLKRGWTEEEIGKFLGGNFLRVIRENVGA